MSKHIGHYYGVANTAENIWNRLVPNPETGCIEWVGSLTYQGYGKVSFNDRFQRVHRLVYELKVGQIPKGLVLDHLCRNKRCANIEHLEPVTIKVNVQRGVAFRKAQKLANTAQTK